MRRGLFLGSLVAVCLFLIVGISVAQPLSFDWKKVQPTQPGFVAGYQVQEGIYTIKVCRVFDSGKNTVQLGVYQIHEQEGGVEKGAVQSFHLSWGNGKPLASEGVWYNYTIANGREARTPITDGRERQAFVGEFTWRFDHSSLPKNVRDLLVAVPTWWPFAHQRPGYQVWTRQTHLYNQLMVTIDPAEVTITYNELSSGLSVHLRTVNGRKTITKVINFFGGEGSEGGTAKRLVKFEGYFEGLPDDIKAWVKAFYALRPQLK